MFVQHLRVGAVEGGRAAALTVIEVLYLAQRAGKVVLTLALTRVRAQYLVGRAVDLAGAFARARFVVEGLSCGTLLIGRALATTGLGIEDLGSVAFFAGIAGTKTSLIVVVFIV